MRRSQQWFNNPDNQEMTALYLERYLNYGLTREELQSGKPIIGIAQTGSDLSPCNRHHIATGKTSSGWHRMPPAAQSWSFLSTQSRKPAKRPDSLA